MPISIIPTKDSYERGGSQQTRLSTKSFLSKTEEKPQASREKDQLYDKLLQAHRLISQDSPKLHPHSLKC